MIRLCFLIRQLNDGGAQRQLAELVEGLDQTRFDVTVVTLYGGGRFVPEIERIPGVRLVSLDKVGRWDVLPSLWRLLRVMRSLRPDILHSYVSASNLLAALLKPFLPGTCVVWGVRASDMDPNQYDWLTRAIYALERVLSRSADLIIANSKAGKAFYVARGFPAERTVVIPNGIDTDLFYPDREAGRRMRGEWGIPEGSLLIGLVARLDPMKDHLTFLAAARILAERRPDVCFVCVGSGSSKYAAELRKLGEVDSLAGRLVWAGARGDMSAVYNALDVATSSSRYGEGFSNVVAEAMACAVPCVVTDVGDSGWIVGDTGATAPPADPSGLAAAWERLLEFSPDERRALGWHARERIATCFARDKLVALTTEALSTLL